MVFYCISLTIFCCFFIGQANQANQANEAAEEAAENNAEANEEQQGAEAEETEEAGTEEAKNTQAREDGQDVPPAAVEDITTGFGKMSVNMNPKQHGNGAYSLSFHFPYIMYQYTNGRNFAVTVDFMILGGQNQSLFRPSVSPDGKKLLLKTVIPSFFANQDRIQLANGQERRFNESTHKATAFE